MSVLDTFWSYIYKYYPELAQNEWMVDELVINAKDLRNEELTEIIPMRLYSSFKCYAFFYEGGMNNVIFLLQDPGGDLDIAIGKLNNNVVSHIIKL
jgi:hypothetical protein